MEAKRPVRLRPCPGSWELVWRRGRGQSQACHVLVSRALEFFHITVRHTPVNKVPQQSHAAGPPRGESHRRARCVHGVSSCRVEGFQHRTPQRYLREKTLEQGGGLYQQEAKTFFCCTHAAVMHRLPYCDTLDQPLPPSTSHSCRNCMTSVISHRATTASNYDHHQDQIHADQHHHRCPGSLAMEARVLG